MTGVSNKQRILRIKNIFFKETDENQELSFEDLVERLKVEYGLDYEISIKAIKDDIKILREHDTYLIENTNKYGKKMFSQQNRLFEINELRTLIDSISSAGSISTGDKERLIRKIKMLTSENLAQGLSNQIYSEMKIINEDNTFRINLDNIHVAIQNKNKINFKYGRYDINKKFKLNEKLYIVDPYGLVWDNGFYYLIAYDKNKDKIINFRIDRIRNVIIRDKKYKEDVEFKLSTHLNSCFNMYPGNIKSIEMKFHKHLINAIIDKFGINVDIKQVEEDYFILYTRAAINTGLIRWILNWGSDAIVLKPNKLVEEIKREIRKMDEMYLE